MAEIPKDTYVASAQPKQSGQSALIITADNTQDLEFFYPYYRLIEEGFTVDVATPGGGAFKGKMGMGLSETKKIADIADPTRYDLLYIPGGKAPAELKENNEALELVRAFAKTGKPLAAICHGAQVLAGADLVEGKRIAAWPEVEKEIIEAGGEFVNEATVVDGQFITARWPGDLPSHLAKVLEVLNAKRKAFKGSSQQSTGGQKEAV